MSTDMPERLILARAKWGSCGGLTNYLLHLLHGKGRKEIVADLSWGKLCCDQ
jgi:hypothetical protein